jgi:Delta7-sterol 5-desaturase
MKLIQEFINQLLQLLGQSLINYLTILIVYLIVWKLLKERLKNWRIQLKQRVNSKQLKAELRNSLFTLLVSSVIVFFIYHFKSKGYTKIYTHVNEFSKFYAYGGLFILMIINETWFYWIHRLLHNKILFKYIHIVHHKSIDVNPFTSLSFHWMETFALTCWIIPLSLFFPIYVPILGILQVWGLIDNIKGHLGYELYPSWWNKSLGKLLTSSTHHNMHHSKFKGNYGLQFRIWDKLLGTEFDDYEKTFEEIQKRKKNKSSTAILLITFIFISATAFS